LKNCASISPAFVEQIGDALRSGPNWNEFRKLEVEGCPKIDRVDLERTIPSDRFVWKNDGTSTTTVDRSSYMPIDSLYRRVVPVRQDRTLKHMEFDIFESTDASDPGNTHQDEPTYFN